MMADTYQPVDCSFHDELEVRVLRGSRCHIVYRDENGREQSVTARLMDIGAHRGEEFLRLEGGAEIRLDRILCIDGLRA